MRYRNLGSSGIDASVVALGTWAIGGWMWGGTEERASIEAIRVGVDNGMNLIDTAPVYGFGLSERIVGKAIAGIRDQVVLATKCGLVWDREQGDFHFDAHAIDPTSDPRNVYKYLDPESIRREVEASLQRLGTDRIDLYQTHWQESTTPIADTMAELLKLKDEGKIRAVGVSNAGPEQLREYLAVGPVDCDQEKYSMLDRGLEATNLPVCRQEGIAVLAYSPLAQGLLTGKITPEREYEEGDMRRTRPRYRSENVARVQAFLDELRPIAEGYGVTLAQLTIAWTVAQPGLTHALVGARNAQQAVENAAAGDLDLTQDELARIDEALTVHGGGIE